MHPVQAIERYPGYEGIRQVHEPSIVWNLAPSAKTIHYDLCGDAAKHVATGRIAILTFMSPQDTPATQTDDEQCYLANGRV